MAHVATVWRHPIKSHGREKLDAVTLIAGQTMPWDRHWAVTHEASKFDADEPKWVMCRNFMIGAATPGLAGINAALDESSGTLTLTHAALGTHVFQPDNPEDWAGFMHWVLPLCPPDKRQPNAIVKAPDRGMTDTDFASVSIMNMSSHRAVADKLGCSLEPERWRGNIWLEGLGPWEEFEWLGRNLRIGEAEFAVKDRIQRCAHTTANPHSGQRDRDTLGALRDGWNHQDFGVYATVTKGGKVAVNDKIEVI